MGAHERPLSPHLQVYRWQITNTLSILHRATGVMLSLGLLVLICWLIAIASGADSYANVMAFYGAAWFKLPVAGWIFCFFYHLANGVRHLFWDVGRGFEPAQIQASGWAVVVFALIGTALYAGIALV